MPPVVTSPAGSPSVTALGVEQVERHRQDLGLELGGARAHVALQHVDVGEQAERLVHEVVVLVVAAVHRARALAGLPERVLLLGHRLQLGEDLGAGRPRGGKGAVDREAVLVRKLAHRRPPSLPGPRGGAGAATVASPWKFFQGRRYALRTMSRDRQTSDGTGPQRPGPARRPAAGGGRGGGRAGRGGGHAPGGHRAGRRAAGDGLVLLLVDRRPGGRGAAHVRGRRGAAPVRPGRRRSAGDEHTPDEMAAALAEAAMPVGSAAVGAGAVRDLPAGGPRRRPAGRRWPRRSRVYEQVAEAALAAAGAPDPSSAAPAFNALADGFALHHLARPRPGRRRGAAPGAAPAVPRPAGRARRARPGGGVGARRSWRHPGAATALTAATARRSATDDGVWAVTCDPGHRRCRGARASPPAMPGFAAGGDRGGAGNVPAGTAWRNAVGLAALLGLDVPVGIGGEDVARRHADHAGPVVARRRRARRAGHRLPVHQGAPRRRRPRSSAATSSPPGPLTEVARALRSGHAARPGGVDGRLGGRAPDGVDADRRRVQRRRRPAGGRRGAGSRRRRCGVDPDRGDRAGPVRRRRPRPVAGGAAGRPPVRRPGRAPPGRRAPAPCCCTTRSPSSPRPSPTCSAGRTTTLALPPRRLARGGAAAGAALGSRSPSPSTPPRCGTRIVTAVSAHRREVTAPADGRPRTGRGADGHRPASPATRQPRGR